MMTIMTICMVINLSSCRQMAEQAIGDSVEKLDRQCPVSITNVDRITSAEYVHGTIVIRISENNDVTPETLKELESSKDAQKKLLRAFVKNSTVQNTLGDITGDMEKDANLQYKFVCSFRNTSETLVYRFSINEMYDLFD